MSVPKKIVMRTQSPSPHANAIFTTDSHDTHAGIHPHRVTNSMLRTHTHTHTHVYKDKNDSKINANIEAKKRKQQQKLTMFEMILDNNDPANTCKPAQYGSQSQTRLSKAAGSVF